MKQIIMTITAVVLLVLISLCGCIDSDEVSFSELRDHLGKYVGKEITVKGYVADTLKEPLPNGYAGWAFFHESIEKAQAGMPYIYLLLPENITLYRGWYKVTGVIEESQGIITIFAQIKVTAAQAV